MSIQFHKVQMPAFWASYLINGDASGITPDEREACDEHLAVSHIAEVVDVEGEPYFSWSFAWHGGNANGGDLAVYTVRYWEDI